MSEPEEVVLDGAHHATKIATALWRRLAPPTELPVLPLADVRQRLELFTGALFATAPPIGVAEPPALPNWFARLARRTPRHLVDRLARASTDGERIRLPARVDARAGLEAATAWYRLLAVEQAARAARGTPRHVPGADDLLLRDLFLLAESVAVDRAIALELPGLLPDLRAARAAALASRPSLAALTPLERWLELLIRSVLAAPPAEAHPSLQHCPAPSDSLVWARATVSRVAVARSNTIDRRYRGLPVVEVWGLSSRASDGARTSIAGTDGADEDAHLESSRVTTLARRPAVRHAPEDEDDQQSGIWMIQIDDPKESVEDPMGLQRPTDRDDAADPGELADSLSELPEARLVPVPGPAREVLASRDPPLPTAQLTAGARHAAGVAYPEWDWRADAYLPRHAVVRERTADAGSLAWADAVLQRHAREVQLVRSRFERLRPQRTRMRRQLDGCEMDLSAYVTSFADRSAGGSADDRLYEDVRPMRRDIAIMLLVDISGSTDSWIADTRRIIDVEKEALLLVGEALDALGDRYAILAFSGEGPEAVSVRSIKEFGERYGSVVRARIGALDPDRYTRSGAAIRHATALLCREQARHRLLLVLSDGKPNDVDVYEGRYGIEDTRQAVAEARMQGLHPFCLTVDRQAPVYLSRVFGPGSYAVLRQAERLPGVLVEVVRRLLRV